MIKTAKHILFFIALTAAFSFTIEEFTLEKKIQVSADFMTTDNLGNCYAVRGNILEKYDPKGILLKTYSNKQYGKISFVDATNPLNILVFYSGFIQIVFLDNMLAEQGEPVSIEKLGHPQTILVCASHNDGFWIYDQQNMELLRFNKDFQLTGQTGNISQLTGNVLRPNYLIEVNNKVHLSDPKLGILVFDVFGTYNKTVPLPGYSNFQVKENEIYYSGKPGEFIRYNLSTLEQNSITLPDSSCTSARFEKNKLYLLNKDNISIYSFK